MEFNKKLKIAKILLIVSEVLILANRLLRNFYLNQDIDYVRIILNFLFLFLILYLLKRYKEKFSHGMAIMWLIRAVTFPLMDFWFSRAVPYTIQNTYFQIGLILSLVTLLVGVYAIYLFIILYKNTTVIIPGSWKKMYSPSKKYVLITSKYKHKEWILSKGTIYQADNEKLLFNFVRNHNSFPFAFVEGHKNGHDYLICGEDYQGQTILELDTQKRADYLPKGYKKGVGFCWIDIYPSKEKDVLAVEGCYWACPTDQRFIDFSDPMNLPYQVLSVFSDVQENKGVKGDWSSDKGVEITYMENEEVKKTVTWKRPANTDIARYWFKEVADTKSDSYFFPDILVQAELAFKKLSAKEIDLLKSENLIPSQLLSN